jgi:hypothetical protein
MHPPNRKEDQVILVQKSPNIGSHLGDRKLASFTFDNCH